MLLQPNQLLRHEQGLDDFPAVGIAQRMGAGPFGVGHHSKHVATGITDPCNIADCPIRVGFRAELAMLIAVIINDLSVGLQRIQCFFIGIITALPVCNGDLKSFLVSAGGDEYISANKLLIRVAEQGTGQ